MRLTLPGQIPGQGHKIRVLIFASALIGVFLENRDEVVLFLVELPIDGAQCVYNLAAGHVGRESPTEGQLIAFATAEIPLLQRPLQAPDGSVGVFLAGIRHDDKEFVPALAEDNVAASKARGEQAGKVSQQQVALDVPKLRIDGAETVEVNR